MLVGNKRHTSQKETKRERRTSGVGTEMVLFQLSALERGLGWFRQRFKICSQLETSLSHKVRGFLQTLEGCLQLSPPRPVLVLLSARILREPLSRFAYLPVCQNYL